MTEQRDWYLSTLGISQYRQRLPGEAVFKASAGQVDVAANIVSANNLADSNVITGTAASGGQVGSSEVVASLASIRETLQDDVPATNIVVASDESRGRASPPNIQLGEELAQGPDSEQENISFTLACWQVSDELLLINGFTHGQRVNRVQLELLANILRAIQQFPQSLPPAELIEWPLKSGVDSSLTGAKTQLAMFLLGRQQVRPYRWLLAMGDEPARLLAKKEGEEIDLLAQSSAETIFMPSLQTMLAEPLSKREAWRALHALRGG